MKPLECGLRDRATEFFVFVGQALSRAVILTDANIPLHERTTCGISSPTDGHAVVARILYRVSMSILVHITWWTFLKVSPGCVPKHGLVGS